MSREHTHDRPSRVPVLVGLALLVTIAFGYRAADLAAAGLAEDEVNKVNAARAYLAGDFGQNLEHPMLMKALVAATFAAADLWNAAAPSNLTIPDEVSVRLPNVLFGSLTTVVLFLLAELLFGATPAWFAAWFWALGVPAIAINRIAKEDTLLVFFLVACLLFHERAKQYGNDHRAAQTRCYGLAGACLGLMLASKYFPHYWGVLFLAYHFAGQSDRNQPLTRRDYVAFYVAFPLAFVLSDPVVLLPSTWQHFAAYIGEATVSHHGYELLGRLYPNNIAASPGGPPVWFYPLVIGLKTQIPILVAFCVGLAVAVRSWRSRPFFLVLFWLAVWFVIYSAFAGKFFRYVLSVWPFVAIVAGVGVERVLTWTSEWIRAGDVGRRLVIAGLVLFAAVGPAVSAAWATPFNSLYLNPLGGDRAGAWFPHDEFYDAGLREAIQAVCAEAPSGALVEGEAPPVFRYYQQRYGRDDLRFRRLSEQSNDDRRPDYVIVQEGRRYFENTAEIDRLAATRRPVFEIRVAGVISTRVYRLEPAP